MYKKRKRGPPTRWIPRASYFSGQKRPFRAPARARGRKAGFIPPELKFHDVDIDDGTISNTGTIQTSLNLIAQGLTESDRIGRKCTVTAVNWRFQIAIVESDAAGTPQPTDVVRVLMFLDKQANGAAAVPLDILETADYQSFNNLSNKSRFRTLMDRTYTLNYTTLASDGAGVVSSCEHFITDTFFKKVRIPLEFSAGTGALTELRSNNLGVLLISRGGTSAFESKVRIRFSDG